MNTSRVYEEVVDFIAGGFSPASILVFQPSASAKQRVSDLIEREKAGILKPWLRIAAR